MISPGSKLVNLKKWGFMAPTIIDTLDRREIFENLRIVVMFNLSLLPENPAASLYSLSGVIPRVRIFCLSKGYP